MLLQVVCRRQALRRRLSDLLPTSQRDDEVDDVPEAELDGPEVSAASKALRNLSFAKAVGKFKSTLENP